MTIPMDEANTSQRLAKCIAAAGVCSRRDAEKLIISGDVTVNGQCITTPAFNVSKDDLICIQGSPIAAPEKIRLWLYHKPPGLLTTNKDPEGRPTIFSDLPENLPRVVTVGRLDMNSEGLLLLTNSGELSRSLELPSSGLLRTYRVRVAGQPTDKKLGLLKDGISVNGVFYQSVEASLTSSTGNNSWLSVTLSEGKNREIRNIFEHLDHPVSRLIRTSYGPFKLGDLARSHVKEIPTPTLSRLLSSAKISLPN